MQPAAGLHMRRLLAASLAAARVLRSFLFGVTPQDSVAFGVIACALITVCLAGGYLPARRAARVDPMVALRHD